MAALQFESALYLQPSSAMFDSASEPLPKENTLLTNLPKLQLEAEQQSMNMKTGEEKGKEKQEQQEPQISSSSHPPESSLVSPPDSAACSSQRANSSNMDLQQQERKEASSTPTKKQSIFTISPNSCFKNPRESTKKNWKNFFKTNKNHFDVPVFSQAKGVFSAILRLIFRIQNIQHQNYENSVAEIVRFLDPSKGTTLNYENSIPAATEKQSMLSAFQCAEFIDNITSSTQEKAGMMIEFALGAFMRLFPSSPFVLKAPVTILKQNESDSEFSLTGEIEIDENFMILYLWEVLLIRLLFNQQESQPNFEKYCQKLEKFTGIRTTFASSTKPETMFYLMNDFLNEEEYLTSFEDKNCNFSSQIQNLLQSLQDLNQDFKDFFLKRRIDQESPEKKLFDPQNLEFSMFITQNGKKTALSSQILKTKAEKCTSIQFLTDKITNSTPDQVLNLELEMKLNLMSETINFPFKVDLNNKSMNNEVNPTSTKFSNCFMNANQNLIFISIPQPEKNLLFDFGETDANSWMEEKEKEQLIFAASKMLANSGIYVNISIFDANSPTKQQLFSCNPKIHAIFQRLVICKISHHGSLEAKISSFSSTSGQNIMKTSIIHDGKPVFSESIKLLSSKISQTSAEDQQELESPTKTPAGIKRRRIGQDQSNEEQKPETSTKKRTFSEMDKDAVEDSMSQKGKERRIDISSLFNDPVNLGNVISQPQKRVLGTLHENLCSKNENLLFSRGICGETILQIAIANDLLNFFDFMMKYPFFEVFSLSLSTQNKKLSYNVQDFAQDKEKWINNLDSYGNTAIHTACFYSKPDICAELIANGASVFTKNIFEQDPETIVEFFNHAECKEILAKSWSEDTVFGLINIHVNDAKVTSNNENSDLPTENSTNNTENKKGPSYKEADLKKESEMQAIQRILNLIEKKIESEKSEEEQYNRTILMLKYVFSTNSYKFGETGLRKILNSSISSRFGNTVLHVAVENSKYRIVDALIQHGCVLNTFNFFSETPIHIAIRNGDEKMVALLLNFVKQQNAWPNLFNLISSISNFPLYNRLTHKLCPPMNLMKNSEKEQYSAFVQGSFSAILPKKKPNLLNCLRKGNFNPTLWHYSVYFNNFIALKLLIKVFLPELTSILPPNNPNAQNSKIQEETVGIMAIDPKLHKKHDSGSKLAKNNTDSSRLLLNALLLEPHDSNMCRTPIQCLFQPTIFATFFKPQDEETLKDKLEESSGKRSPPEIETLIPQNLKEFLQSFVRMHYILFYNLSLSKGIFTDFNSTFKRVVSVICEVRDICGKNLGETIAKELFEMFSFKIGTEIFSKVSPIKEKELQKMIENRTKYNQKVHVTTLVQTPSPNTNSSSSETKKQLSPPNTQQVPTSTPPITTKPSPAAPQIEQNKPVAPAAPQNPNANLNLVSPMNAPAGYPLMPGMNYPPYPPMNVYPYQVPPMPMMYTSPPQSAQQQQQKPPQQQQNNGMESQQKQPQKSSTPQNATSPRSLSQQQQQQQLAAFAQIQASIQNANVGNVMANNQNSQKRPKQQLNPAPQNQAPIQPPAQANSFAANAAILPTAIPIQQPMLQPQQQQVQQQQLQQQQQAKPLAVQQQQQQQNQTQVAPAANSFMANKPQQQTQIAPPPQNITPPVQNIAPAPQNGVPNASLNAKSQLTAPTTIAAPLMQKPMTPQQQQQQQQQLANAQATLKAAQQFAKHVQANLVAGTPQQQIKSNPPTPVAKTPTPQLPQQQQQQITPQQQQQMQNKATTPRNNTNAYPQQQQLLQQQQLQQQQVQQQQLQQQQVQQQQQQQLQAQQAMNYGQYPPNPFMNFAPVNPYFMNPFMQQPAMNPPQQPQQMPMPQQQTQPTYPAFGANQSNSNVKMTVK